MNEIDYKLTELAVGTAFGSRSPVIQGLYAGQENGLGLDY